MFGKPNFANIMTDECKYQGVIFTENLNWSKHIDQMCSKAKKINKIKIDN